MRKLFLLTLGLSLAATAVPARAEWWWTTFWGNVHRDYQRNNAWPEPFNVQDRETVTGPFNLMVNKGWERQNLLMDHHFDEKGLTTAGQLKVRWIVTQAPVNRRIVFIQRANTPEQTRVRVDLAQQAAQMIAVEGELPRVAVSDMDGIGTPAEYVDAIGRKFQASTPDPRLSKSDGSSGGSSTGASGSK